MYKRKLRLTIVTLLLGLCSRMTLASEDKPYKGPVMKVSDLKQEYQDVIKSYRSKYQKNKKTNYHEVDFLIIFDGKLLYNKSNANPSVKEVWNGGGIAFYRENIFNLLKEERRKLGQPFIPSNTQAPISRDELALLLKQSLDQTESKAKGLTISIRKILCSADIPKGSNKSPDIVADWPNINARDTVNFFYPPSSSKRGKINITKAMSTSDYDYVMTNDKKVLVFIEFQSPAYRKKLAEKRPKTYFWWWFKRIGGVTGILLALYGIYKFFIWWDNNRPYKSMVKKKSISIKKTNQETKNKRNRKKK